MKKYFSVFTVLFSLPLFAFAESTVDLQWSICDVSPEIVLEKLEQTDAKQKINGITYYDTASPQYLQDGVTFRIKEKKEGEISSVKIRFAQEIEIPEADCEWDRYGSQIKYTCEVTAPLSDSSSLWSQEQKDFLVRYYHRPNFRALKAYGPYENRKWKLEHKGNKISFDSVDTPEAGPIMELSLKVPYSEKDEMIAKLQHWLEKRDVVLCARQESKTHRLFLAMGILR